MHNTEHILENILENAKHNITKNIEHMDCIHDARECAESYLEQKATLISRDINNTTDKEELINALQHQVIGNAFVLYVCLHYLEEAERQVELDQEPSFS